MKFFSFQCSIKSQTIYCYVLDDSSLFLHWLFFLVNILQDIAFIAHTNLSCYVRNVYLQKYSQVDCPCYFAVSFGACFLTLSRFTLTLLSFISSRIFLHLFGVFLVCMSAWLAGECITPSFSKVWKCWVKDGVNMLVFLVAQFGCTYHLVVCDNWMKVRMWPRWWVSEIQRTDRVFDCKRTI